MIEDRKRCFIKEKISDDMFMRGYDEWEFEEYYYYEKYVTCNKERRLRKVANSVDNLIDYIGLGALGSMGVSSVCCGINIAREAFDMSINVVNISDMMVTFGVGVGLGCLGIACSVLSCALNKKADKYAEKLAELDFVKEKGCLEDGMAAYIRIEDF